MFRNIENVYGAADFPNHLVGNSRDNDFFGGGAGDDVLAGGPGDDSLDACGGADEVDGRGGTDDCVDDPADVFTGCENLVDPPF